MKTGQGGTPLQSNPMTMINPVAGAQPSPLGSLSTGLPDVGPITPPAAAPPGLLGQGAGPPGAAPPASGSGGPAQTAGMNATAAMNAAAAGRPYAPTLGAPGGGGGSSGGLGGMMKNLDPQTVSSLMALLG